MGSQYKSIQGIKYERDLLEAAETATARGRAMTKEEASQLWEMAMDGNRVTATERRTLEYVMDNFRLQVAAKTLLKAKLSGDEKPARLQRKGSSYYKTINGISYDRQLLEEAQTRAAARGGMLLFDDALHLWGKACDGNGITATEKRTLQYVAQQHRLELEAQQFLEKSLGITLSSSGSGLRALTDKAPGLLKSLWNRVIGRSNQETSTADLEPEAKRRRIDSASSVASSGHALEDVPPAPASRSRLALAEKDTVPQRNNSQALPARSLTPPISNAQRPEDDLMPEMQKLLSELSGRNDAGVLSLELPAAPSPPEDVERAAQKAKAAAEVDRILASRNAEEVLGRGSKDEQRREFKRLALLLHPDKGYVEHDDARAGLAMRLAMAALNRSRSSV